jgi:hypothetical protein
VAGQKPENAVMTAEPQAEAKTKRLRYAEKFGIKDEYAGEKIKDVADKAGASCSICALILGFLLWERSGDILGLLTGLLVAGGGIFASYILVSVMYSYGDMVRLTVEQTRLLKRLEARKLSELLDTAGSAQKLEQQKKELSAAESSGPAVQEQEEADTAPPSDSMKEDGTKKEAVPSETAGSVDKLNRIARFAERPYTGIICPVCARRQAPDRDTCFYCGCSFVFDDEEGDGRAADPLDQLRHRTA